VSSDAGKSHLFRLTITLKEYTSITLNEQFEVEIQPCIVKQVKKVAMGASPTRILEGYTESFPYEFWLYYVPEQLGEINTFSLIPSCPYELQTKIQVVDGPDPTLNEKMEAAKGESIIAKFLSFSSNERSLD
jgi:hypothetical protein